MTASPRLFVVVLFTIVNAGLSVAQQLPRITAGTGQLAAPAESSDLATASVPGCPNQSGLLDSISVPVGKPLNLKVVIFVPAPPGGATFQLSSDDPTIAAAGDPKQAFLPTVFIPEGQTISNSFTIFGISVGSTLLRITPLTPGFGSSATPLGAWDINKSGNNKFLDANPPTNTCRTSGGNDLSTDPNVLAVCGNVVQGVATDGVSQLLMRTVSGLPGTACYQITSTSSFDQGSIPTPLLSTQQVGNLNYGFSFYMSPASFGDTSNVRNLEVEFTFTPSIGNGNTSSFRAQTNIVRAPVLLVHGLWSNAGAWGSDFKKEDQYHTTYAADYGATNGASFSANFNRLKDFANRAITNARAKGFAVTQTDVMGHSMGGLLTRLFIANGQDMRPDNFGKGDVRRLLSLDTPHNGSNFANLLVALHRADPTDTETTVLDLTGSAMTGGAICDLAENSPALQGLSGPTNLRVQAITGTNGPAGTPQSPAPYWGGFLGFKSFEGALTKTRCVNKVLGICTQSVPIFPQDIVNDFRFRQMNDAVVGLSSQQGGIAGINFPGVLHFGPSLVGGVTNTSAVATQAYQLLDGPDTGLVSAFPGVISNGTGSALTVPGRGAAQDAADYSNQCTVGGPLKPSAASPLFQTLRRPTAVPSQAAASPPAPDNRVQIASPTNGQHFAPGDTVSITVNLAPPLTGNDLGVDIPGLTHLDGTSVNDSQYQASFVIPSILAGPLTLIPAITDSNNIPIQGPPVTIAIQPSTPPLSISLLQKNFRISPATTNPSEGLYLSGTYSNGIVLDINSSAAGTTYQSTNPLVIQVNAEGVYQVTSPGISIVTATNSGLKDFATFVVEDPANPLPPSDFGSQVTLQQGGFRLDRTTGFLVESVSVINSSAVPIPGPLFLVISNLPSGITLVNKSGITQNILPGSSYLTIPLVIDGLTFQPGQAASFILQFLDPNRSNISYSATVQRTAAIP
jgi:pimeloyl-ACP methyl ester carboxylesterase